MGGVIINRAATSWVQKFRAYELFFKDFGHLNVGSPKEDGLTNNAAPHFFFSWTCLFIIRMFLQLPFYVLFSH